MKLKVTLTALFLALNSCYGAIGAIGFGNLDNVIDHHRQHSLSPHCRRDLSTLRQLIVIFRYGDITPVTTFPNDIYQEKSWPNGFGQLTQRGIERSYELGRWMRTCYDSFLHTNPSPRRVYVRSSDYDRTLMSAQAVMAGLYPPVSSFKAVNQKWGETCAYKLGQLWRPFPIHSVPAKYDRLLRGNLNCPRFDELTTKIDFSKKARRLLARHRNFVEKLGHESGIKTDDLVKVVSIVESAVLTEVENGRVPVEWLNTEKDLDLLVYFRDLIVGLYFDNRELTKLVSGKMVQELLDRMIDRAAGKSKLENILYSAHSTVMEGLLASLGTLNSIGLREPPYGSAIIFELHKVKSNYGVVVYYRNSSTHDPMLLSIPGCNHKMDSESFSISKSVSHSSIGAAEPDKLADGNKNNEAAKASPIAGQQLLKRFRRGADDADSDIYTWKRRSVIRDKKPSNTRRRQHQRGQRLPFIHYKEHGGSKHRMTMCKLTDFKKLMARKASRTHDLDCRPKHRPKKAASTSGSLDEIGQAPPTATA